MADPPWGGRLAGLRRDAGRDRRVELCRKLPVGGGGGSPAVGGAGATARASDARRRGTRARREGPKAANELQKLSGADAPTAVARKIPTVAIEKKPFDLGDYLWESSLSVTTFMGDR